MPTLDVADIGDSGGDKIGDRGGDDGEVEEFLLLLFLEFISPDEQVGKVQKKILQSTVQGAIV